MDKILFLNEKDRNTGLSLEHSDYRYKTAKPVAATKPKHDEVGFTIPYAMFRPIREPGLLCELLGDNPVRRTADLKMNFDFLVKDLYENEISRLMYVVRLEELRCRLIFSSEDRAWERYTRLREKASRRPCPRSRRMRAAKRSSKPSLGSTTGFSSTRNSAFGSLRRFMHGR